MKIQLKHLSPYLPYDLKILYFDSKRKMNGGSGSSKYWIGITATLQRQGGNCKPILRPLSDLTKEIEINGEKLVPIKTLLELAHPEYVKKHKGSRYSDITIYNDGHPKACFTYFANLDVTIYKSSILFERYWIIEKLFEWHFDVFGLIPEGLAININN